MNDSIQNQKTSPMYISICTQKGGAGKSVFTTLAASYLHYLCGYNVAVIDCDYPQWSIHNLREREASQITKNAFYYRKAAELFQKINKRAYPVVPAQPETALSKAKEFLDSETRNFDIVFFDLPGTVNNRSVVEIVFNMDYLFVPITTSRINMESTLYFIVTVNNVLKTNPFLKLKSVHAFWNKMTSRERKELLECYENAMADLKVPIMQTRIPQSVKYDREQSIEGNEHLFLSTLFPPDKPLLKGSNWDMFIKEFVQLINLKA
jgi:cellulose biosynthesis protein BcsQ